MVKDHGYDHGYDHGLNHGQVDHFWNMLPEFDQVNSLENQFFGSLLGTVNSLLSKKTYRFEYNIK